MKHGTNAGYSNHGCRCNACCEAARIRSADYYRRNRKRIRESQEAYKRRRLEERAGIPKADTCELCGAHGEICFDHCHRTGQFRGWVCQRCNRVLGAVDDDVAVLAQMIVYLCSPR